MIHQYIFLSRVLNKYWKTIFFDKCARHMIFHMNYFLPIMVLFSTLSNVTVLLLKLEIQMVNLSEGHFTRTQNWKNLTKISHQRLVHEVAFFYNAVAQESKVAERFLKEGKIATSLNSAYSPGLSPFDLLLFPWLETVCRGTLL